MGNAAPCISSLMALTLLGAVSHPRAATDSLFDFFTGLNSPRESVSPRLPRSYSVPVKLSGGIADEMRTTLSELNLEEPEYIETFDRKKGFELLLANDSYASETRDLLSGILNPIEMIDMVLRSIVQFREEKRLREMLAETRAERTLVRAGGRTRIQITLRPTGNRFSYSYVDMGAFIQETWLTSLTVVADSAAMQVEQMKFEKHSRLFDAEKAEKPATVSKQYQYRFFYDTIGGAVVPSKLLLDLDAAPVLSIAARYQIRDNFLLFDSRSICYLFESGRQTCLDMEYGTYNLNVNFPVLKIAGERDDRAKQVRKAAALAARASEALREGKIETAVRTMRLIAKNYPGTPQAVEARRLLDGLPQGF